MALFPNPDRRIAAAFGAVAALGAAAAAAAPVAIAGTSFEREPAVPGFYTDTGDLHADHALDNHVAEPLVDSTAASTAGGELGFTARYVNSRGGVGLTDGDYVGVTSDTSAVGRFPDGGQGYHLSDADGAVQLEFAPVDLSLQNGVVVLVDLFVRE